MAKRSSDPRVAYPNSKFRYGTGPSASCEYCNPFAPRGGGVSIRGKFVSSRNPRCKASVVAMWLNVVLTPG